MRAHGPFVTANRIKYGQFCIWDDMQTAESKTDSSGKQICCEKLRNTDEKLVVHEWTNWGRASGQTGGAARSALASTRNDCSKFRHCPGLVHVLQNPIMYDTWGGASNIFSAKSL